MIDTKLILIEGHPVLENQPRPRNYQKRSPILEKHASVFFELIYFAIDDLRAFAERTIRIKDEEWQRAGYPGSWAQHIYQAFDSQPWFTNRRLTGLDGMLALLEEWAQVSEMLYDRVPFPKIKTWNPHTNWALAMQQMSSFLGLD